MSATTPTADLEEPTAPTNLTATAGVSTVDLTWTPGTDNRAVVTQTIRRDDIEIATLDGTTTTYTDTALQTQTAYTYDITSIDADGNNSDPLAAQAVAITLAPPTGLWAAYGFEDVGPVIADSSVYGNDGALAPPATRTPAGFHGAALQGNGSGGYVDLDKLDAPGDELTLMAWINADSFETTDARIISKATGTQSDDHLWMLSTINGPSVRFRLQTDDGNGTTTLIAPGATLAAGTWQHVTATYDGTAMRLFVDGAEVASTPKTGAVLRSPTMDARIGANPDGTDKVFHGRIDDVKIFGRALTPAEIGVEMATPVAPPGPDTEAPTAPGAFAATPLSPVAGVSRGPARPTTSPSPPMSSLVTAPTSSRWQPPPAPTSTSTASFPGAATPTRSVRSTPRATSRRWPAPFS